MENDDITDDAIIDAASEQYCDDECELAEFPEVSRGDGGAWVQTWVYVSYDSVVGSDE